MARLTVDALRLPLLHDSRAPFPLYPHQARALDALESGARDVLITTPTGSGKTAAVAIPLLRSEESAIFLYPTKALMADQEHSLRAKAVRYLAHRDGLDEKQAASRVVSLSPRTPSAEALNADLLLIRIDGETLEEWRGHLQQQRGGGFRHKGQVLMELLASSRRQRWVITNPDILFLIFALRYHKSAAIQGYLQDFQALIVDEFHLYSDISLLNIVVLLALASDVHIKRRVLLSATPDEHVIDLLARFGEFTPISLGSSGDGTEAVHAVSVQPELADDAVDQALAWCLKNRDTILNVVSDGKRVGGLIILNSVVNAILLERRLRDVGFPADRVASIRGLVSRAARDVRGRSLVVGTAAVEVGVDFDAPLVWFEALDASAAIQHFGRAGRHGPGKATLSCPVNVFDYLTRLDGQTLTRPEFEREMRLRYAPHVVHTWFAVSEEAADYLAALEGTILEQAAQFGQASAEESPATEAAIHRVFDRIAQRLGTTSHFTRARLWWTKRQLPAFHWMQALGKQATFRSGFESVDVHDWSEQRIGREPEYTADLYTLLRRSVNPHWDAKRGRLHVQGVTANHDVFLDYPVDAAQIGRFLCTGDIRRADLRILVDGKPEPLAELISSEPHVLIAVPDHVREAIPWTLPVLRGPGVLFAFDGVALIVRALYHRHQARSPIDPSPH